MIEHSGRRALFAGALGIGVVATGAAPAEAAGWQPRDLRIGRVRRGDMIIGPGGRAVRVAGISKVAGRFRVTYNDPYDKRSRVMNPPGRTDGYSYRQRLVVLARYVPVRAIAPTESPAAPEAPAPLVTVDGGAP